MFSRHTSRRTRYILLGFFSLWTLVAGSVLAISAVQATAPERVATIGIRS